MRSMGIKQGIAVDANQIFGAGRQGTHAQGIGFPQVFIEVDHPESWVLTGKLVEDGRRIVRAAVVDGDDFEIRVLLRKRGAECFSCAIGLVVARHEDADEWHWIQGGRLGAGWCMALATQVVVQPAHHPDERHQDRIDEGEIEQDLCRHGSSSWPPVGKTARRERCTRVL